MSNLAPIILFVYNRPEHTRRTVEALAANSLAQETDLFIFADGPKNDKARPQVEAVRKYVESLKGGGGFKSVTITAHDKNQGLANSVIAGTTTVLNSHDRAIIVEDDILTCTYFLTYMNDALEMYKNDENVAEIDSYHMNFDINIDTIPQTFFYPYYDIWGWGTWTRAWKDFNPDPVKLLNMLKERNLIHDFDIDNEAHVYSSMLKGQIKGKIDSWAIRWSATNFLLGRLALHPKICYSKNIGLDGTGIHCGKVKNPPEIKLADSYEPLRRIPIEIHPEVFEAFKAADRKANPYHSIPYRALRKLWRITQKLFTR